MAKTTEFTYKAGSALFVYDWSNPANWSNGLPADGDSVILNTSNEPQTDDFAIEHVDDDIPGLSLASLAVYNDAEVAVSCNLQVTDLVNGDTDPSELVPVFEVVASGGPVTATIGTVTAAALTFDFVPVGTGATLVVQNDPGNTSYEPARGGLVEVVGTPSSSSYFEFDDYTVPILPTTFAFEAPAATNASQIEVAPGDTIELPGTSVAGVLVGANSLSVTTSAGSYSFTNVTYFNREVRGYTATFDQVTGLLAITFDSANRFQRDLAVAAGA